MAPSIYEIKSATRFGNGLAVPMTVDGARLIRYQADQPLLHARTGKPADALITEPWGAESFDYIHQRGGLSYTVLCPESEPLSQAQLVAITNLTPTFTNLMPFVKYSINHDVVDPLIGTISGINHTGSGVDNSDTRMIQDLGLIRTNSGGPLMPAMGEWNLAALLNDQYKTAFMGRVEAPWEKTLEDSLLAHSGNVDLISEVLVARLMSVVLRQGEMFEFGRTKFNGCGVGKDMTIYHDQLTTNEDIGVARTIGIVFSNDTLEVAQNVERIVRGLQVKDAALIHESEATVSRLSRFDYVIRIPGSAAFSAGQAGELSGAGVKLIDPMTTATDEGYNGFSGNVIKGSPVNIVGCGNIGREFMTRLALFGADMRGHDAFDAPREFVEGLGGTFYPQAMQAEFLRDAQRLFLTMNLIKGEGGNENWLNGVRLAQLPEYALIGNSSRGGLVDEGALMAWLNINPGARAVVDVILNEYGEGNGYLQPIAQHPSILVGGHTASAAGSIDGIQFPLVRKAMFDNAVRNNLYPEIEGGEVRNPKPLP